MNKMTELELKEFEAQTERMKIEFNMEKLKFDRQQFEIGSRIQILNTLMASREFAHQTKNFTLSKELDEKIQNEIEKLSPTSKIIS